MLLRKVKMNGSERRVMTADGPYTDAFVEAPMSQQTTPAHPDRPDLKRCTRCKQHKPRAEFHRCRSRSDGLNNKCKACASERIKLDRFRHGEKRAAAFKRWREANAEHLRAREARRRVECRAKMIVAHARIRAKRKGLPFDLDQHLEELQRRIDEGRCEMTGLPLNLEPGGPTWDSPSLDRIVPAAGYVLGNVRIICHGMNNALGDWGEEVLEMMVAAWRAMQSVRKRRRCSSKRFSPPSATAFQGDGEGGAP